MTQLLVALLDLADAHADTIMPGFTHLQTAQPVTFGHHMLAWFEMLLRDRERLVELRRRVNVMPLGSAALAGTTFPIDRAFTARELGFETISENSLDAVSDRDFAIEFCSAASIAMMHLSRWSEELVLWSSQQFGFIDLPDRFCTGSSIMPQKKNPDVPELVRGKTGRVFGHLMGLLDADERPAARLQQGQSGRQRAAVRRARHAEGLSHRDARHAAAPRSCAPTGCAKRHRSASRPPPIWPTTWCAKTCRFATHTKWSAAVSRMRVAKRVALSDLSLAELQRFSPVIDAAVFDVLTLEGSVNARNHIGGTAPAQVRAAIARGRTRLG